LPGEPRLQFSEGCRAGGGGAIRQKNLLASWFLIVWAGTHSFVRGLRSCCLPVAFLFFVAVIPSNAN
jgi:hypothetical protein